MYIRLVHEYIRKFCWKIKPKIRPPRGLVFNLKLPDEERTCNHRISLIEKSDQNI
jgi:hypothetical protein